MEQSSIQPATNSEPEDSNARQGDLTRVSSNQQGNSQTPSNVEQLAHGDEMQNECIDTYYQEYMELESNPDSGQVHQNNGEAQSNQPNRQILDAHPIGAQNQQIQLQTLRYQDDLLKLKHAENQSLKLQLEEFSDYITTLDRDDPSKPPGLAQIEYFLQRMRTLLLKIFLQCRWVCDILDARSKSDKEIIGTMVVENMTWLIRMLKKYPKWNLAFGQFYKLIISLQPKFTSSEKAFCLIKEWRELFCNKTLTESISITITPTEFVDQEEIFVSSLNYLYFQQKIALNLNDQFCSENISDVSRIEQYFKTLVGMKDRYAEFSVLQLNIFAESTNGQSLLNYLEARVSILVIERLFSSYLLKHENGLKRNSEKILPLKQKIYNELQTNIEKWSQRNLEKLISILLKIPIPNGNIIEHIMGEPLMKELFHILGDSKICINCLIAYRSFEFVTAFTCDHQFCHHCFTQYVDQKIKIQSAIQCLQDGCNETLNQNWRFYKLMPKKYFEEKERIDKLNIVRKDPSKMICLNSQCSKIIDKTKEKPFSCNTCKNIYCHKCNMPMHQGLCEDIHKFLRQKFNNIQCFSCKQGIEKASGCNHIICNCRQQLCYNCGQKYHPQKPCQQKTETNPSYQTPDTQNTNQRHRKVEKRRRRQNKATENYKSKEQQKPNHQKKIKKQSKSKKQEANKEQKTTKKKTKIIKKANDQPHSRKNRIQLEKNEGEKMLTTEEVDEHGIFIYGLNEEKAFQSEFSYGISRTNTEMEIEGRRLNVEAINNFGLERVRIEEEMMYEEDDRPKNEEKKNYDEEEKVEVEKESVKDRKESAVDQDKMDFEF